MGRGNDESKPDNIFDLSRVAASDDEQEIYGGVVKKNTEQKSHIAKKGEILPAEQEQLLQNYTEVPRENWEKIPAGIHIRYLRNDGTFRRGGIVKNIVSVLNGRDKDGTMIQMSYSASYNSKSWNITLAHIERIWQANANLDSAAVASSAASSAAVGSVSQNTIIEQTEKIDYLTKAVDQIKIDIAKINNEQQRIVNLIKKLHNIRGSSKH